MTAMAQAIKMRPRLIGTMNEDLDKVVPVVKKLVDKTLKGERNER